MNMRFHNVGPKLRPSSAQWRTAIAGLLFGILLVGCATEPLQTPPLPLEAPSAEAAPKATSPKTTAAGELLLFGGSDHDAFLGCLNCGKYDSGSIWNKYGSHGSRYSAESIWNRYGTYGSQYSSESPWNRYGQSPPAIVDREGNFYGYFTANRYFAKRTRIEWLLKILDNYEEISENFDDFVDSLK